MIVNRALIGYTSTSASVANVTGILNPGTYNGVAVNLLPLFTGAGPTSNVGGQAGVKNLIDGGGAAPLMAGKPSNDSTSANPSSNQYFLVTHLYQFFGVLLGCSKQGAPGTTTSAFAPYQGVASMTSSHKFMNISNTQNLYFIQQVGLTALSFGVTVADATAVGSALNSTFNLRCSAPAMIGPGYAAVNQSVCATADCIADPASTCAQTLSTKSSAITSSASWMVAASVAILALL